MNNKLDSNFKKQVAQNPGGANVMNCYLCGTCTAGCPVSELDSGYSPRAIMRMVLLGLKDELLTSNEIWKCSQCNMCTAHCPQNARPADVIAAVRELAEEEGKVCSELVCELDRLEDELKALRLEKIGAALKSREV